MTFSYKVHLIVLFSTFAFNKRIGFESRLVLESALYYKVIMNNIQFAKFLLTKRVVWPFFWTLKKLLEAMLLF